MDFKHLILEKENSIATLRINRPDALNALNSEVLVELSQAVDLVDGDPDIHVLVLTGQGKSFVAGADIAEMKDLGPEEARAFASRGLSAFRKLEQMEKPVIAAVNGYALGGGCELAMSCDIRIASSKAKFGQPEV